MARPLLPDGLWAEIAPPLPSEPAKLKGGRPRTCDRAALMGILFVLRSGTPWELLPREMGCGSGMTCWRRLRDWQMAGVWDRLQQTLLDRLGRQNGIDFSRASLDSASIAAKKGARRRVRTRPIEPSPARSVTSSPMRRASPDLTGILDRAN